MTVRPWLVASVLVVCGLGCKKETGHSTPPIARDDAFANDQDVIRAYNAATGSDVKCDPGKECSLCIARPDALKGGVAVVGSFAYDRGCKLEGFLVGKSFFEDAASAMPVAFARAGWETMGAEARKKLALAWLTDVAMQFSEGSVISDLPAKDFAAAPSGTPAFEPPRADATPQGGVTLKVWWSRGNGGGKMPTTELTYWLERFEVTPDAKVASDTTVTEFKVPYTH